MTRAARVAVTITALLCGCSAKDAPSTPGNDAGSPDGSTLGKALTLSLVTEKQLSKLLPTKDVDHYEASGIVASNGVLYVASDNLTRIAAIDTSLDEGKLGPGLATDSQYEAITATDDGRFFAMIETATIATDPAAVAELDADTAFIRQTETDVIFEHPNKGFEGAAWLRASGKEYLLALCENNNCKDDESPAGEGRVQLLAWDDGVWTVQQRLKLPEAAAFVNYSDLALTSNGDGSYLAAVVSRKSSALWLGTLSTSPWGFSGPSTLYTFPRSADGAIKYCSIEGITFLGRNVLAAVSDKSDGGKACADEEESIHIFRVPQ
jgi:hypothetical protein